MTEQALSTWAIVELMGHRTRPGFASEVEIAGGKMLRIDVPVSDTESITEFYGVPAIYSIRPTTEDIARDHGYRRYGDPRPVQPASYRPAPAISAAVIDDDGDGSASGDEDDLPY